MAFVEPITIVDAIENVHRKNYLLPAIQREFVWSTDQIEKLFDSLMRGYPINSFLFWEIDKDTICKYQFYEFVRDYHERDNRHNLKANLDGINAITAILDGQQRLTSLYIGLRGSYAYKMPRKRWDNDSAFPKRKLCLNLLSSSEATDLEYDFAFLTKQEAQERDDEHYWFAVSDILNLKEAVDVNDYLVENDLAGTGKDKFRFANKALFKLYEAIHRNKCINFFLERDESLDKVLNVFIRVNSGGTQLSYSDLLLSVASAQWKEKDAREEITSFVDEVNSIGDGFSIDKDFVLKSCLVLSEFKDIAFKVDNFNQKNMIQIESKWEDISKAIKGSFLLLSSLGYHRDTLTSNNALIPIALYLSKIGNPSNFAESFKFAEERRKIFKWLVIVLLKRTFSGQPDNVLRPIRDIINNSENGFPFEDISERLRGSTKTMTFDDDELDNLLSYQYSQPYTYSVLAFIYPSLDFRNKFHQDHIFPRKLFTQKRLEKRGISAERIEYFLSYYNYLGNIQLLEGVPNQEKSGKDFDEWIQEQYPNKKDRQAYMERHYIPDVDLSLGNFKEFLEEREKLILAAFKNLLK
jgi:uncharacterized protein with ParB-like and HNH nuclease domain